MFNFKGVSSEKSGHKEAHIQKIIADNMSDVSGLGVAVLDSERRHVFANQHYADLLGIPLDALDGGLKIDKVIEFRVGVGSLNPKFKTTIEQDLSYMSERLASGKVSRTRRYIRTNDGLHLSMKGFYTADHYMLITVEDVTDAKRQDDLLAIAMEEGRSGYWAFNLETNQFTYSDSVKSRLSEREIKRIEETGLWAIINQEDLPDMMGAWQETVKNGTPLNLTYRVTTEMDGTMWQRSKGKIHFADNGEPTHVVAYVTDITQDVDKQQELVATREASHMKTEFLARMSHEIKTPLNAIIGLADVLLQDAGLEGEARETAEYIDKAAESLNTLLSQILEHAKLSEHKVTLENRDTNIRDLLNEKTAIWNASCKTKGLRLLLTIDDTVPQTVILDSHRFEQCINNILSNAIKFTQKGTINVIVKCVDVKGTATLAVAIKDTGIGMTPEQAEKIFAPFEQADTSTTRLYGGTGLGMSITQQTLKLMGGHIRCQSAPGKGSVFLITLPVTQQAEQKPVPDIARNATAAMNTDPKNPFANLNVLCVEDNKVNHLVVQRLIGNHVKSLTFAENGLEALQSLKVEQYDIVLMDIHMPEMNGIETTIEIRNSPERWANVIIIALTADPDYQHARICRNLGMDDSIAKPVRRKDLFDAFERAFDHLSAQHGASVKIGDDTRGRLKVG